MEYNTSRNLLVIPEYGRHVQGMLLHAKTIADPRERQAFVEKVVNMVVSMNTQNKNPEDYREKVWKHVFLITNFELEVTPPSGVVPTEEDLRKHPDRVPYPQKQIHYRHYGYNVQQMVDSARAMTDPEKRKAYSLVIANYMKLAYRTWNREHFVSDDVILGDLEALSEGELSLHHDTALDQHVYQEPYGRSRQQQGQYQNKGGGKQKYQQKGASGGSGGSGGYKRKRNKQRK